MTMRTSGLKPGQCAPVAGLYQQIGPHGAKGSAREVGKGEPLPSTPKPGSTYTLVEGAPCIGHSPSPKNKSKPILLTKKGRPLPGVDIGSRAKLYELMDGIN